jgi:hypothetical protein
MAEYPTTTVGSELISAGLNPNNPAQTYSDFATQLATNQQTQAMQAAQIARAQELAKQAQMETGQQEEANEEGVNPLTINTMTPEQAGAYVTLILKTKGIPFQQKDIDTWVSSLNGPIEREAAEAFANRFMTERTQLGQATELDADTLLPVPAGKSAASIGLEDMQDEEGNSVDDKTISDGTFRAHVPNDGMYQIVKDSAGNVVNYINAGKEPSAGAAATAGQKQANIDNNRWSKLQAAVQKVIAMGRFNQLPTAILRADRAINELASSETLSPQVLKYIQQDVSGIFQGGVPPQSAMEDGNFETVWQQLNGYLQKWSGNPTTFATDIGSQRSYILGLVTRLRDSSLSVLEQAVKSQAPGYQDIISKDPARWNAMITAAIDAVTGGLTPTAAPATAAAAAPTTPQPIPGITPKAGGRPSLDTFNK